MKKQLGEEEGKKVLDHQVDQEQRTFGWQGSRSAFVRCVFSFFLVCSLSACGSLGFRWIQCILTQEPPSRRTSGLDSKATISSTFFHSPQNLCLHHRSHPSPFLLSFCPIDPKGPDQPSPSIRTFIRQHKLLFFFFFLVVGDEDDTDNTPRNRRHSAATNARRNERRVERTAK